MLWLVARGFGASGAPAGSTLSITLDDRLHTIPLEHGAARVALPAPPLTLGAPVILEAAIDGAPLAPLTIPVVLERSDHGAVAVAGGGCSVHPSPHGLRGWLVLAPLALLLARRQKRPARAG
jgi:MYXO-CTERM domain-containing protein